MTTDELLLALPPFIGSKRTFNDKGEITGYCMAGKHIIGHLTLERGKDWEASYSLGGKYVCMNPYDENPPYNNAVRYGSTPNEALQRLYDWCIENGFIKADTQ